MQVDLFAIPFASSLSTITFFNSSSIHINTQKPHILHIINSSVELFLLDHNIAGLLCPRPKSPPPCSAPTQHTPLSFRILVKHSLLVSGVLGQGQSDNPQDSRPPGPGLSSTAARDFLNSYIPWSEHVFNTDSICRTVFHIRHPDLMKVAQYTLNW